MASADMCAGPHTAATDATRIGGAAFFGSAGSGATTTLDKLACELGWDASTFRANLDYLIPINAVSASPEITRGQPTVLTNLADQPPHARFALHLDARFQAASARMSS